MATCDIVSKYVQRVTGSIVIVGPISITFPLVPLAYTQSVNASVAVPAAVSTVVLAANAARQFAEIQNDSASVVNIAFGAAAVAGSIQIQPFASYVLDINTLGKNCQQSVEILSAGGATIRVVEFV